MVHFNKIIKNKSKIITNLKGKLLNYISILVICLVLSNTFLYYLIMKTTHIDNLIKINESIVKQTAISCETIIENIQDSVYQTVLYDEDFKYYIHNFDGSTQSIININNKLNSISLFNEFVQSTYLYMSEYNQVYSTANNLNRVSPLESFNDKVVFDKTREKNIYLLDPRIYKNPYSSSEQLILSFVCSVPIFGPQKNNFLVLNIDINRVYENIFNTENSQNSHFYVLNSKNEIIMDNDMEKISTYVDPDILNETTTYDGLYSKIFAKNITLTSQYYSPELNYNFVLVTVIPSVTSLAATILKFVTISILLIIFSLIVLIAIVSFYTKPVKTIVAKYNEKLLKDFLLDKIYLTKELKQQLQSGNPKIYSSYISVVIIQFKPNKCTQMIINEFTEWINNYLASVEDEAKIIELDKNIIGLIVGIQDNTNSIDKSNASVFNLVTSIINEMPFKYKFSVFWGISSVKNGVSFLPLCYNESITALKYKLSSSSSVISYNSLKGKQKTIDYPYDLENHILNNIVAGDIDACKNYYDHFFDIFTTNNIYVEDTTIKNFLLQLINSIYQKVSTLSVNLEYNFRNDFSNFYDMDDLYEECLSLINNICALIIEKRYDNEYELHDKIMKYIEREYLDLNFSMNRISETFNLSRNKISKIVKKITKLSYTDYINRVRIDHAKKLLENKNIKIENVAKESGYNYSYYFIRVFKKYEGETPGQYRDSILENQ